MQKTSTHVLFTSRKRKTGSLKKLWAALREYGVDNSLSLAVKFLYSCSEVCVRVGGVVSHDCSPRVLAPERALPPLLFMFYMNWIDSHSGVNEMSLSETEGSTFPFLRTIWCCLHLLNRIFNMHLIGFLLRATDRE